MKVLYGTIVLLLLLGGLGTAYWFRVPEEPLPATWAEANKLPASPQDATYRIEGSEVTLSLGTAHADVGAVEVWGTPAVGDLADRGAARDAALLLRIRKQDGETAYYAAAALWDTEGYLGSNTVFLGTGLTPLTLEVHSGLITVRYLEHREEPREDALQEIEQRAYLVAIGADLRLLGPIEEGELVLFGELTFEGESGSLTICTSKERHPINPNSRAYAALKTVYRERTHLDTTVRPVFVVLTGRRAGNDQSLSELMVRLVLHAPRSGSCADTPEPLTETQTSVE